MATESHHKGELKENRLAKEKSPYLLQHKYNPVDWYPWGKEAFEAAKKEQKPIFLSVGYSTCHWCHVMAHESFEDESTAQIMNKYFINIKVDREERPDIDKIYMTYVQATQGGGGWPMSVFLTPDLKPMVAGTYFPPKDAYGRKGFPSILAMIHDSWTSDRNSIMERADRVMKVLQQSISEDSGETGDIDADKTIQMCFNQISKGYDQLHGGFGGAPKFPRPIIFDFLFRYGVAKWFGEPENQAWKISLVTLKRMSNGGMYDHIGGGFHRYSVTRDWHIPHYEKMLYDQGQLLTSLVEAYQISKDDFFAIKAKETANYVLSKLTSPEGGFYCAEDADSLSHKGATKTKEGAFYVWTWDELKELLGDHFEVFANYYGVEMKGNAPPEGDPHGELTGKNTLIVRNSDEFVAEKFNLKVEDLEKILEKCRKILYEKRETRPRPHLDDKIIVAWNGLMITGLAKLYEVFGETKYLEAAVGAVDFIKKYLYKEQTGTLIRNYRGEASNIAAFTDDYAFLVQALLDLYEVTLEINYLKWAVELQKKQDELFLDKTGGGYFMCGKDDPSVLLRMKEDYDGAEPSNNSVSALNLMRFSFLLKETKYQQAAEKIFNQFTDQITRVPVAVPKMVVALMWVEYIKRVQQIVLVGTKTETAPLRKIIYSNFLPFKTLVLLDEESRNYFDQNTTFSKDMHQVDKLGTSYVCQNFTCLAPVTTPEDLTKQLFDKF